MATLLLRRAVTVIEPGEGLRFALDAPQALQAAGRGGRHPPQPDPGPADQKFFYGHVGSTRAWLPTTSR